MLKQFHPDIPIVIFTKLWDIAWTDPPFSPKNDFLNHHKPPGRCGIAIYESPGLVSWSGKRVDSHENKNKTPNLTPSHEMFVG